MPKCNSVPETPQWRLKHQKNEIIFSREREVTKRKSDLFWQKALDFRHHAIDSGKCIFEICKLILNKSISNELQQGNAHTLTDFFFYF